MIDHTSSVASLLVNGVRAFSTVWKITRTDGVQYFFTDHDQNIVYDGNTYTPMNGLSGSAIEKLSAMEERNVEVNGVISDTSITDDDLRAGKFRDARIDAALIDWRAPWNPPIDAQSFWIGSIEWDKEVWKAELAGLTPWLERKVGRVYSPHCDNDLGVVNAITGYGCEYNLTANRIAFTVEAVLTQRQKVRSTTASSADATGGLFVDGYVQWTGPANMAGVRTPVKLQSVDSGKIAVEFQLATPFDIAPTTWTGHLYPGCSKTVARCKQLGQFPKNFGGFPIIPGPDEVLKVRTTPRNNT